MSESSFRAGNGSRQYSNSQAPRGTADGVKQYGTEYGMRKNGGSAIAKNSRSHDDRLARFEPFFGQLQQDRAQDPYDDYARDTFSLPEAYHGPNAYIRRILATWISEADQWPIREMLPWKKFDGKFQIQWNIWTFDDHMLERVPERSAGRLLTSRKESHEDYMVRYGIAFLIEHEFADTPDGAENYRKNLLQIVNASIETFCHGAMMAVMDDKNIGVPKRHLIGTDEDNKPSAVEARLRQEMKMWGIVQKTESGLELAVDHCEETLLARFKARGDYIVIPRGVGKYVKYRPENRYFFIAGPSAGGNATLRRDGVTIREARSFRVGVDQPDVDPTVSERTIGAFFTLNDAHLGGVDAENLRTSMMDTVIYSETHDDWKTAKYIDAIMSTGLFVKDHKGAWKFGTFGRQVFNKEGDNTVGDFLEGVNKIDKVIASMLALPETKFWRLIKALTDGRGSNDKGREAALNKEFLDHKFQASLLWTKGPDMSEIDAAHDEEAAIRLSLGTGRGGHTGGRPSMSSYSGQTAKFMAAYDNAGSNDIAKFNRRYWSEMLLYGSGSGTRRYGNMQGWAESLPVLKHEPKFLPFNFLLDVGSAIYSSSSDASKDGGRFSKRWKLSSGPDSVPSGNKQWWYIHGSTTKRFRTTSSNLQAIASPTSNDAADRMIVVGAPSKKYDGVNPTSRHVEIYDVSKRTADTNVAARSIGEALFVLSYMYGLKDEETKAREGKGASSEASPPTLHEMWVKCKRNLEKVSDVISKATFTVHPSCMCYRDRIDAFLLLVSEGKLSSLDSAAARDEFLGPVTTAFNAIYPESVSVADETKLPAPAQANEDSRRRRVETFVQSVYNESETKSAYGLGVDDDGSDMGLAEHMRLPRDPRGPGAVGMTTSRVMAAEQMRQKDVWARVREANAETSNPAALHQHAEMRQFDETMWTNEYGRIMRMTPNLYSKFENLMKCIFRARVLDPMHNTVRSSKGQMTKTEFIKIMALIEHANKLNSESYNPEEADMQTSVLLADIYHVYAMDVPDAIRTTVSWQNVFNGTIEYTKDGLARFIQSASTAGAKGRTLLDAIRDTSAHMLWFMLKCQGRYWSHKIESINMIKETLRMEKEQAGSRDAINGMPGAKSFRDLATAAGNALGKNRPLREAQANAYKNIVKDDISESDLRNLLYSIIITDGEFWRIACEFNLHPSLGVIGFRPHQTYIMCSMVYMAAYGAAGWTFEGLQDFQLGEDAYRKMIFGNFTMWGKSLVMVKEAVTHARDMYSKGHVYGNGIEVYDPNNPEDVQNYKRGEINKDIFYCYVPIDWQPKKWYMDISGNLSSDLGGSRAAGVELQYPTAKMYRNHWGWRTLSSFTNRPLCDSSGQYGQAGHSQFRNNTLVFQDVQKLYSPNNGGGWTNVVKNEGPWGPNVMPGTAAARRGERMSLPVPTYLNQASISLTAS